MTPPREPAVLVTGGTGFVGSALVRVLERAGAEVHVLARPGSERSHLAGPFTWHVADLVEPDSVRAAMRDFCNQARSVGRQAQVVHAAALISYRTADAAESRRVNVEGTRSVLEAAHENGAGRVCLVSSVVAVGQAPDARSELDESARFNGARLRSQYVTTKRAAEDYALAVTEELPVVVVNPGAIFGAGPRPTNTSRFLRHLARGTFRFAPPGSLSVVGVEDVAEGIRLALERGRDKTRYLLTESNWTLLDLMREAAEAFGVRPPRGRIPGPLWSVIVGAAAVHDRFRPQEEVTPQGLRLLAAHYRFDASRARDELGWTPRPFGEVLRDTIEWMRREDLLT